MRSAFLVFIACALLVGCKQPDPTAQKDPAPGATAGGKSGSDDIAPLGAGAGAMTPVAGGENLGGTTGGGVGQMAKNQARKAAANSTPSMSTGSDDSSGQ